MMTESARIAASTPGRQGPPEQHMQGHWLLASLGKRVLRPGGRRLTARLLAAAGPSSADRIVEFGPGLGKTAAKLLAAGPASYTAVDPNPEGTSALRAVLDRHDGARLVVGQAADTGLPGHEADLVVGEAMLSMHSQADKEAIVAEAARLLAPGGRYAIHELLRIDRPATSSRHPGPGQARDRLSPDAVGTPHDPVSKEISRTIKVGARPLTLDAWEALLTAQGLQIEWTGRAPMRLLEPSRIIADEGPLRAATFFVNLARNKPARARVMAMRKSFRDNADSLGAIAIVARRPAAESAAPDEPRRQATP